MKLETIKSASLVLAGIGAGAGGMCVLLLPATVRLVESWSEGQSAAADDIFIVSNAVFTGGMASMSLITIGICFVSWASIRIRRQGEIARDRA